MIIETFIVAHMLSSEEGPYMPGTGILSNANKHLIARDNDKYDYK